MAGSGLERLAVHERDAVLMFKIKWPERDYPGFRAAAIPTSTRALVVRITGEGRTPATQTFDRPAGPATAPDVRSMRVAEGSNLTLEVKAYREFPVPEGATPIAVGTVVRSLATDLGGAMGTLAGTGAGGFANAATSSATFNSPTGVAVMASGDILVADQGNDVIRLISGGQVSTFAGGGTSNAAPSRRSPEPPKRSDSRATAARPGRRRSIHPRGSRGIPRGISTWPIRSITGSGN